MLLALEGNTTTLAVWCIRAPKRTLDVLTPRRRARQRFAAQTCMQSVVARKPWLGARCGRLPVAGGPKYALHQRRPCGCSAGPSLAGLS
jgi:hypothetical protein